MTEFRKSRNRIGCPILDGGWLILEGQRSRHFFDSAGGLLFVGICCKINVHINSPQKKIPMFQEIFNRTVPEQTPNKPEYLVAFFATYQTGSVGKDPFNF